ncbi:DUF5996 family protein [Muricauda sp. 2012CJ35-5]|uniref:DUF5996 family protein n=1 Tax=Flagellimonas spongiicola TaxID=2942208 RepID=A0ABT0PTM9_9FLAO|nr:DUF5996 family protein [Allomuricauda spongiicola]MCL6274757.1 DUF5996 family protein [Allomuricauda spongiicola]
MGSSNNILWPILNFQEIQDTLETLHQWIQIVGKIRLRAMPWQNHSWHTALYISSHGFSTHSIPYGDKIFQIDFDFEKHQLQIECGGQETQIMGLTPMSVADFHDKLFRILDQMGLKIKIHGSPNEIEPAIPFRENTINKSYDPNAAHALWQAMLKTNAVFHKFRGDFVGKCSPVHLFWGAFDLAVTRFSGNSAPLHPGGMPNMPLEVMQEAYSKEVSSAGFWPGSKDFPFPAFYAYAYPSDSEFGNQKVEPKEAFYSEDMGEFFLKYEDVQKASNPEEMLYAFLQTTYEAAANTSKWDRESLEK